MLTLLVVLAILSVSGNAASVANAVLTHRTKKRVSKIEEKLGENAKRSEALDMWVNHHFPNGKSGGPP